MCSIVMPADYEMLVSHSPPAFSHSPPAGFLNDYFSLEYESPRFKNNRPRVVQANNLFKNTVNYAANRSTLTKSLSFNQDLLQPEIKAMPAHPRRPCLVIRPDDSSNSSNDEADPTSPTRLKKKVVFADDRGRPLTHVRVMSEPSNVPPVWSIRFLSQVTKGISAEAVPEPWEVTFPQPASDYVEFRKSLDTGSVSLENVIVRESEDVVVGTVKVRNISFKKEVFVRCSFDDWKTHEDAFCQYVKNTITVPTGAVYVLYDTFSFRFTLPPKSRRIEFCVCFRCDGNEYWDNNKGKNYILLKKAPISANFQKSLSTDDLSSSSTQRPISETSPAAVIKKCKEVTQANLQTWSEFASWTHLETTTPYW